MKAEGGGAGANPASRRGAANDVAGGLQRRVTGTGSTRWMCPDDLRWLKERRDEYEQMVEALERANRGPSEYIRRVAGE